MSGGVGRLVGRLAGEGQEHLVEGGASQADVVDHDRRLRGRTASASCWVPPSTGMATLRVAVEAGDSGPIRLRASCGREVGDAGGVDLDRRPGRLGP